MKSFFRVTLGLIIVGLSLAVAQIVSAQTATRLGGMNLDGYCTSLNQGTSRLANNAWSCTNGTAINMTSACQWQYPGQNATASQDNTTSPYSWTCYAGTAPVTPTSSPTATSTPTRAPTAIPTSAPTGTTLQIYADSLLANWTNASYNTTSSQTTTTANVYSGSAALAANIQADGGLDFQAISPVQSSSYATFHFALKATQNSQQYEIYADSVFGQPLQVPVSLSLYGGQPTTSWKVYNIPLSVLNASNVAIKDVVIHDATSTIQPTIYVDDVSLTGNTAAATPTPTAAPVATAVPTTNSTPTVAPNALRVRKSIYALTPTELQHLVAAINTVRNNGQYQDFMNRHLQAMMTMTPSNETGTQRNVAHRGPSFLAWHRAFTYEFEDLLRTVDPTVTLPYWPFEQETPGQTPRVFTAAYFGSDGNPSQGDRVIDGPFASWGITRRIARDPDTQITRLPTQADVSVAMAYTNYETAPYIESSAGVNMAMEGWIGNNAPWGIHNDVHGYIGGDMGGMNAVNDPIFFLVHANIDRLWWQWQQKNGINTYQPTTGAPTGHNLNDTMTLLQRAATPASVLDIQNQMGYTYN